MLDNQSLYIQLLESCIRQQLQPDFHGSRTHATILSWKASMSVLTVEGSNPDVHPILCRLAVAD